MDSNSDAEFSRRSKSTPLVKSSRTKKPHISFQDYDARLDDHQQTYVLSPRVMSTLNKTMTESSAVFTSPSSRIGFHTSRRPLLLSYPSSPRKVGTATFQTNYRRSRSAMSQKSSFAVPQTGESKETVRLALDMRSTDLKDDQPIPKKLPRVQTIPPQQTKAVKLAKEKGFVLDGVAVSSIQNDFGKINPKLGPAIPPYNAHLDRYAKNYFSFKGLDKTLIRTGQLRKSSESLQGKSVDRFHLVGFGHEYLFRRNLAGSGYSRNYVDGHDQFLSGIGPMDGYCGRFGYRRNTPGLRHCPSPFGVATWSPIY